jgi:biotin transport system substrate-specific component
MSGSADVLTSRDRVLADLVPGARVRDVVLVGVYALLIGASAQVAVPLPFTPVPITGQTLAVLLGAVVLGSGRAAAGTGAYLVAGLAGLPWFAAASPVTFGYVIGFVAAAAVVGWLAGRGLDRRPVTLAAAMVVGNLVIYAVGVPYLAAVAGTSLAEAVRLGALPFVPGDLVKIAVATALVPAAWALVRRSGDHGDGPQAAEPGHAPRPRGGVGG